METNDTNNINMAENAEPEPEAPDAQPDQNDAAPAPPTLQESRLPTKKDTSLREFLGKMDDYAPIVCSVSWPPATPGSFRLGVSPTPQLTS